MAWFNIKLPDDSREWREYQDAAKRNSEELRAIAKELRAMSGEPPRNEKDFSAAS